MAVNWKYNKINRFYGLNLKTNPIDVKDGYSLDCQNVFQDKHGVVSKRRGNTSVFSSDETATTEIDEVGSATLGATKYYFEFVGGTFKYATSLTGAKTTISPSPAISTLGRIWWTVLEDNLFFVDGTNVLRFFDGTNIFDSIVYTRPTVAPTGVGGTGFDYFYTVSKGYSVTYYSSESPSSPALINIGSGATISIPANTGPQTLAVNDIIRVYSHDTAVAATSKNVTPITGSTAELQYGQDEFGGFARITSIAAPPYAIVTDAINEDQAQLYSELGVALNKTAPTGLTGLDTHYGRLVAWKDDTVYNAKFDDPHSWPDDSAQGEAFRYTIGEGDSEDIQRCISYLESLVVFKKTQIYIFGGIGPDNTGGGAYSFRRLETNGIGCIAPKAVVVVGEQDQNLIVFLSKQGFYASNGSLPDRIGEKIETQIIPLTESNLSNSYAFYHKRDGYYACFVGIPAARFGWVLDVRKDDGDIVGWFKYADLPIKSVYWDLDRYIFGTYTGYVGAERIAGTTTDFSDIKIEFIAPGAINTSTEEITVTNTYSTGDSVVVRTNGTIPSGITANTTYFVISVSATVIKLAATSADATNNIPINITSQGSGTHSIVGSKAISAYYTTNWINYKTTSIVKKLGKPSVAFDSTAQSINLSVMLAYDWSEPFTDMVSIAINSTHLWGDSLWGSFIWGSGANAVPKSLAIPRRKVRSIRYKFINATINQDFDLQSLDMAYDYIRNRDNFA